MRLPGTRRPAVAGARLKVDILDSLRACPLSRRLGPADPAESGGVSCPFGRVLW